MEIKINGTPKEIAELALELQNRQNKNIEHDDIIKKQIQLLSEKSEICCHSNHGSPDSCKALALLTHALVSLYNSTEAAPINISKNKCTVTKKGIFVQSTN